MKNIQLYHCSHGQLLEQTRAILFQDNAPKRFWGEAILTSLI